MRNNIIAWSLIILGIIGIAASVYSYENSPRMQAVHNAAPDSNQPAPSAKKPSAQAVASYSVAPTLPKYINIPALGISQARILQLGVYKNGQIATPDNIYDTGWYNGSALPGQSGAMFIFGHVSSWTAKGVFYNLKKLVAGNQIMIVRGDNKTYTYQVVNIKVYPFDNVDMKAVLSPVNPAQSGLNLMTCTGQVIKGTSEFSQRLVVFTNLVKSA